MRVHTPSVARHLTDSSAAAGRASTLRTLHGGTPCSTEVSREPAVLSRQRCHHLSALSELIRRPEHDQDQSRGPVRSLRPVTLVAALYRVADAARDRDSDSRHDRNLRSSISIAFIETWRLFSVRSSSSSCRTVRSWSTWNDTLTRVLSSRIEC